MLKTDDDDGENDGI